MTTIAENRTRVARQGAGTVTTSVLACSAEAPDTFPFPSKNRSRTTTQRWVRKCVRSVANSETPQVARSRPYRCGGGWSWLEGAGAGQFRLSARPTSTWLNSIDTGCT